MVPEEKHQMSQGGRLPNYNRKVNRNRLPWTKDNSKMNNANENLIKICPWFLNYESHENISFGI